MREAADAARVNASLAERLDVENPCLDAQGDHGGVASHEKSIVGVFIAGQDARDRKATAADY